MVKFEIEVPDEFWNKIVEDAKRYGVSEEESRVSFQATINDIMRLIPETVALTEMGMPQTEVALRHYSESSAISAKHYKELIEKTEKAEKPIETKLVDLEGRVNILQEARDELEIQRNGLEKKLKELEKSLKEEREE